MVLPSISLVIWRIIPLHFGKEQLHLLYHGWYILDTLHNLFCNFLIKLIIDDKWIYFHVCMRTPIDVGKHVSTNSKSKIKHNSKHRKNWRLWSRYYFASHQYKPQIPEELTHPVEFLICLNYLLNKLMDHFLVTSHTWQDMSLKLKMKISYNIIFCGGKDNTFTA